MNNFHPQFLFLVKDRKILVPATIINPNKWSNFDLEKHIQPREEEIPLEKVKLTLPIYLGPIEIEFPETQAIITIEEDCKRNNYEHEVIRNLADLGEKFAKQRNFKFFGIDYVLAPKKRVWKFTNADHLSSNQPSDFVLSVIHLNAYLYHLS